MIQANLFILSYQLTLTTCRGEFMITINIRENEEFIKLGQALKKAGVVGSGVEAKVVILDGLVQVNGKTELQRGKKLHDGDVVSYNGETIQVTK